MIVLFEGPELAGKTTITRKVEETLKAWGLPVQRYDTIRSSEEDTVKDLTSIVEEILVGDVIWLVDEFHFTPWVYGKAKKSMSYGGSDWMLFEAGLKKLDEDLADKSTLFMFITTPPWTIETRSKKTGRKDPLGDGQKAQYWWLNSIHKTDCEVVHFINDKTKYLDRLCRMIADIVYLRWSRVKPAEEKSMLEVATEELGAEVKDEDRVASMGPGTVEQGPELSGGSEVADDSLEIPF
jgi:hypothetical protein